MNSRTAFSLAVSACLGLAAPQSRGAFPTTALKAVSLKQIHSPTTITSALDGSGRLFVCDQPGRILIIQNGMVLPTPFLDISATAVNVADRKVIALTTGYSERGLLGLTFHPGYTTPSSPGYRKFYLNYVKPYVAGVDPTPNTPGTPADSVSVIAEFQVSAGNPNVAIPTSERRLLLYTQPQSNHNGGQVEFGPEIGPGGARYLYIGVGDGGSQDDNNLGHTGGNNVAPRPTNALGNSQDKTRLFGKILRVDPFGTNGPGGQYGIPATNPFVGGGGGVREEIYSYGLRNPWKFSFDWRTGGTNRLFCGDVGGGRTEEINIIVAGGNYGWRYKEGVEFPTFSSGALVNPLILPPAEVAAMLDPIARYAHPGATVEAPPLPQLGYSITGGFVYRGPAIPALQGKYIFGDYGQIGLTDGRLMGLEETAPLSGVFTLTQSLPILGKAVAANGGLTGERILCLGEDESGEIYVGLKTNNGVLALGPDGLPAGGIYQIVPLQTTNTSLPATKDNTIFSENLPGPLPLLTGYPSDALGFLYAGMTGTNYGPYLRRALIAFDISSLPATAIVQSAQVSLFLTKAGPEAVGSTLSLHRLNQTWGEGTSKNANNQGFGAQVTTDDATWVERFHDTSAWSTAGGSFVNTASAFAAAPSAGLVTWPATAQLRTDVQGWVTTPSSNAGWILRGSEDTEKTACQFHSKDSLGAPPTLEISYAAAPQLTRRESWLQSYFPVGQFVDDLADLDGDSSVNLLEYAYGWSPTARNDASTGLNVIAAESGGDIVVTYTFRRDPRAADLDYFLEVSGDLASWETIAESLAGAEPTGTGEPFDTSIIDEANILAVQVDQAYSSPANRFVRLRVVRHP